MYKSLIIYFQALLTSKTYCIENDLQYIPKCNSLTPRFFIILLNSKTYLNVPYAQKDAAKALGAKWDASKKKWYAPSSLDITLFDKWNTETTTSASLSTTSKAKSRSSTNKSPLGTFTHAQDINFVAYSGDRPPWD